MAVSLQQARQICNSTELALVIDSTPKRIKSFDVKQLKSKVARARTLRDKWRGQSEKLVRVAKKKSQAKFDADNARTAMKFELFSETLDRFSKRLKTLESKKSSSPNNVATETLPSKSKPTVKAQHRAQRADVRTVLADAKDLMNVVASKRQSPPTKSVSQATEPKVTKNKNKTPKKAARVAARATGAAKGTTNSTKGIASPTKSPAKKRSAASTFANKSGVRVQASAKSSAFVRGGVKPIRAHVSAKGNLNQARRDNKR
jgi:hypothetical protein